MNFFCKFGLHKWTNWSKIKYHGLSGYQDHYCIICGKHEQCMVGIRVDDEEKT